ncbi:MAG: GNAT family N-acetyltransferase [Serratia liquefaciens]|nr:GNAT family N-acetyltransferase [Serratia liquefaciens]
MTFTLREMGAADVAPAHLLSQKIQWPHRLEDWQQAWSLGGGVIAEVEGDVVGCALRWLWGDQRATLGLVIVAEQCRGQGIARAMLQQMIAPLPDYQLHLVATDQGKPLYQKLGFIDQGLLAQHQCREMPAGHTAPLPKGASLRPALPQDLATLVELDLAASGLSRQPLLAAMLASAEQALVALCLPCQGEFVRVDTPLASGLSPWLAERGLPCVDTPTIMVRGVPHRPDCDVALTFSLVSQAWS